MNSWKHYEFLGNIGAGLGAVAAGLTLAFAGVAGLPLVVGTVVGAWAGAIASAAIHAGIDYAEDVAPTEYKGRPFEIAALIGVAATPVIAAATAYNLYV